MAGHPAILKEARSFELAASLAYQSPKALANPTISGDGKPESLRPVAGFEWNRPGMRKVACRKISSVIQRALRIPKTRELAANPCSRPHSIWQTPPQLTTQNPRKWRNLIVTAGLAPREPEEC